MAALFGYEERWANASALSYEKRKREQTTPAISKRYYTSNSKQTEKKKRQRF